MVFINGCIFFNLGFYGFIIKMSATGSTGGFSHAKVTKNKNTKDAKSLVFCLIENAFRFPVISFGQEVSTVAV